MQDVQIPSGNNLPLTPITFTVNAVGGIKLNLSANKPGGNCATTANSGAGITGMTLVPTQNEAASAARPSD